MNSLHFILFACLPVFIFAEINDITGRELPIQIDKKGTYFYKVDFEEASTYSTYYIATQYGKDNKDEKAEVDLFLGGNCLEECSEMMSEPNKTNYCEMRKDFIQEFHLVKLAPNQACSLFFSIETTVPISLLLHHQMTIQVQDIQTVPIQFCIPNAPIFLEYTPKFPHTFISQAKIYVDLAEKKDVKAVYFGKDSDFQNCNTHYPCEDKHCFAFELPCYEEPQQYFLAFSYVTVLYSNLYIAIYPANDLISETKVTIGYNMPFIVKDVQCPAKYYLVKQNEDTFCEACEEHCEKCESNKCSQCEKGYAALNEKCVLHQCGSFEQYKDTDGKCVQCKDNCKLCDGETKCLECQENYFLFDKTCEIKTVCKNYQYYNSSSNKCTDCIQDCETCVEPLTCQKCKQDFYYNAVQSACLAYPKCFHNQYLSETQDKCLDCSENCKTCKNGTECLECANEYVIKNGICVKTCGIGKFFNLENQKCEYCLKNCKECNDKKVCEVCKGGYYQTKDKLCQESPLCKPGQYVASTHDECKTCPENCTQCKNQTFCQSCKKDFSLVGHQMCAPSCLKYQFYQVSEQKCNSCIEHCENCLDEYSCEKCRKGFSYHLEGEKGSCIQALFANLKSASIVMFGLGLLLLSYIF